MARKRKSKKRSGGGRRSGKRMRGAGRDAGMLVFGALFGGVGLLWASLKFPTIGGKIGGILSMAVGAVLTWKVGNMFVKGLGAGFVVAGAWNTGKSFALIKGIGVSRTFRNGQPMAGFKDIPKVGQGEFPKPGAVGRPAMGNLYAGIYR